MTGCGQIPNLHGSSTRHQYSESSLYSKTCNLICAQIHCTRSTQYLLLHVATTYSEEKRKRNGNGRGRSVYSSPRHIDNFSYCSPERARARYSAEPCALLVSGHSACSLPSRHCKNTRRNIHHLRMTGIQKSQSELSYTLPTFFSQENNVTVEILREEQNFSLAPIATAPSTN